jgi:ribosomal protein RSM22 (predicted rRNA methylase)
LAERQPSKLHVAGSNPVSRSTPSDRIAQAGLALRRAIGRQVRAGSDIAGVVERQSAAYRTLGVSTLADRGDVGAYAAARMPATFAAAAAAMRAGADRLPGFEPRSLIDLAAGTGASSWAATSVWSSITSVVAVEREAAAVELGRRLAEDRDWTWRIGDATATARDRADVVVAGYVLGELDADARARLIGRAWSATRGALVLVEPGSRAGFARILEAREALIASGARIVAPCPGEAGCPVAASRTTWCHFLARLDRSPLHRAAKRAGRSWEDEPFAYLVAARPALIADPRPRVVLGRPRHRPGRVELRVCVDGRIETVVRSRRDGPAYRATGDLEWGDPVPVELLAPGPLEPA